MHKALPARKFINLSKSAYRGQQIYFATLCCFGKRPVFQGPMLCEWLLALLSSESSSNHFSVIAYCLMPDHLHLLAKGLHASSDFLHFLKTLKIKSSRTYARQNGEALWQRRFFDHVLRPSEAVEPFAWYIWLNPVRRELVATTETYAFSGSYSGMNMPSAWTNPNWQPSWK
jgi:putative transposase